MHFFIHTFNSVWQSNRHSNTNKQTNKQTNVQTNEHIHIKDTYVNNLSRVIVILANYPFKIERKKNTCKFSRWILRRRYIILTLLFGTVKLANMPRQFCNICRWNFEKISIRSQVNSEKTFFWRPFWIFTMKPEAEFQRLFIPMFVNMKIEKMPQNFENFSIRSRVICEKPLLNVHFEFSRPNRK